MGGETNGPFLRYVDRGDPAAVDFDIVASGTTDGNWHDLDLTSVVPANAKLVFLRVTIDDNVINNNLLLRKNGNVNNFNMVMCTIQVANQPIQFDCAVAPDSNGVIEYLASNTTWSTIKICIKGWLV